LAGIPAKHEQRAGCRFQGKYLFDGYSVKMFIFCLPFQKAFPLNARKYLEINDRELDEYESEPDFNNVSAGPTTLAHCPESSTHATSSSKDLEIAGLKSQVSSNNFNSQVTPFNFLRT